MKKIRLVQIGSTIISAAVICSLLGCVATERTSTNEVTKTGKNWVETETQQTTKGRNGNVRVENQSFYEKVKCIDRKGREVEVNSPEECLNNGGKIIDEVVIEESSKSRK